MKYSLLNKFIKLIVVLKALLCFLLILNAIFISIELYTTRNVVEGREYISATDEKLLNVVIVAFGFITTLIFDIRTLKIKKDYIYKKWIVIFLLSLILFILSNFYITHLIANYLFAGLGFYSLFLIKKDKKPQNYTSL